MERDASSPLVTGIFWAASEGAAHRALLMDIEADDSLIGDVPEYFLPNSAGPTYGEIVEALRRGGDSYLETASYRIATDGLFVHRTIKNEQFTFFFRGPEYNNGEKPYAAIKKLAEQ